MVTEGQKGEEQDENLPKLLLSHAPPIFSDEFHFCSFPQVWRFNRMNRNHIMHHF